MPNFNINIITTINHTVAIEAATLDEALAIAQQQQNSLLPDSLAAIAHSQFLPVYDANMNEYTDTKEYDNAKSADETDELGEAQISTVMNPERLAQLLQQADAFTRVNSDALDDF